VLGLATAVATHDIAEVFVIANGIRSGRRETAPAVDGTSVGTDRGAADSLAAAHR
jgi:hypothetical protein